MKTHLRFSLDQYDGFIHPKQIMKNLEIDYSHSIPQTLGDQWWFFNCINIPSTLPTFLSILDIDILKQIGNGLSEKEAMEILN